MTERSRFQDPVADGIPLSSEELRMILELQTTMMHAAAISEDYNGLLSKLCLMAESFSSNCVAAIMLYNRDDGRLYVEIGPSLSSEVVSDLNGLNIAEGSCGNALYHREPMYVCDTATDVRWETVREIAEKHNIRACWAFPIFDDKNEPIASFSISCFERRTPQGFHRSLLENCASVAQIVLQRKLHAESRKRWEAEVLKSRKLDSLGVLAGGIAHDFNNLLTAMLGNIDLAIESLDTDHQSHSSLQAAKKATELASGLTQQLLTFAKGGLPVKQPIDVYALLRESASFVLMGSNVQLVVHKPEGEANEGECILNVDAGQINQVIQNLVINSRQAMPEGGNITITLAKTSLPETIDRINNPGGKFLKVTIKDQGTGVGSDIADKIFDPYFTTKDGGSGLGLAMCHSIVKNHNGYLVLEESSSAGSSFSIYLPQQETELLQNEFAIKIDKECFSGRVLVMDDDKMILEVTSRMLEKLGFEVLKAENGEEAIELFRQSLADKKLLKFSIMDLSISGGMGGIETSRKFLDINPNAKIVVSSGYSEDPILSSCEDFGFVASLSKPYSFDVLTDVVCKVMLL